MKNLHHGIAELIGTFMLVFMGVGAIRTGEGLLEVALAFGLVIVVIVAAIGHISGAHLNPAVTIPLLITGKIKPDKAILYIICQLIGAVAAAAAVKTLVPNPSPGAHGVTVLTAPLVSVGVGFALEFVLTFLLVWVVFGSAVDPRGSKPHALFIGLAVVVDILVGGKFTGACMNPARTFGPALVFGVWTDHWLFWVAPILGGCAAALLYNCCYLPKESGGAK